MSGPLRAAVYIRVSTSGQEDNASLATQEAAARAYAEAHGYQVTDVYRDVGSGAELRGRPGLAALRLAMARRAVDVLVAHAIDRLARDQNHLGVLVTEADDAGVRLEFVTEDFEDSAVGKFIRSAKAFVAEIEREKIAERTQRGRRAAAEAGRVTTGSPPLGYQRAGHTYIVDPVLAPIVADVFRWYVEEGLTIGRIAIRLNDAGIPPMRGHHWRRSTIARMLSNPTYKGQAEMFRWRAVAPAHGGARTSRVLRDVSERVTVTVPAIVSAAVYEAAQRLKVSNAANASRNRKRAYLLAGRVVCGRCGRRFRGSADTRGYRDYHCSGRDETDRASRCRAPELGADRLEAAVWQQVTTLLADPELLLAAAATARPDPSVEAAERAQRERALQALAREEARLVVLYTKAEVDEAFVAARARALHAERDRLTAESELAEARAAAATLQAASLVDLATHIRAAAALNSDQVLTALGIRVIATERTWRVEAALPLDCDHTPLAVWTQSPRQVVLALR